MDWAKRQASKGLLGASAMVSLKGEIEPAAKASSAAQRTLQRVMTEDGWHGLWLHGSVLATAAAAAITLLPTSVLGNIFHGSRPSAGLAATAPLANAPAGPNANPALPVDPAFRLQDLTPAAAQIYNASIPLSTAPNPPARRFVLKSANQQDEVRATDCLAAAVYYEAANEPLDGQRAVAQVVLNRLRDPHYPKTVCDVVFQGVGLPTGWQFTFTGDGSLARKPSAESWARARAVAAAALHGFVAKAVGHATHYHTVWVTPYWSPTLVKVANIGAHIFYRWAGSAGLPGGFNGQYAGGEPFLPQIAALDPAVVDRINNTDVAKAPILVASTDLQSNPEQASAIRLAEAMAAPAPTAAASGTDAGAGSSAPETAIQAASPRPPLADTKIVLASRLAPPPERQKTWSRLPVSSGW